MTKYIGGVITKDESKALPENGFEGTSANGVWNLNEQLMLSKQSLWPTVGVTLQRGLFAGGDTGSLSNIVDFIDIASAGHATDSGGLSSAANFCGG